MSWLTPLTGLLVAAFAVPPLLLLYFLKLRRVHRDIPSTMLWTRSVEDVRANAPFQRIRFCCCSCSSSCCWFLQWLSPSWRVPARSVAERSLPSIIPHR